jgi:peptidoglycan/LPS O-acetylase OafA/YrhL
MAFAVACLATNTGNIFSWALSGTTVQSFGRVSYGMYLLHMLILNAVIMITAGHQYSYSGWASLMLVIVLCYLVSQLSYNYYESIFMDFKKKFTVSQPSVL